MSLDAPEPAEPPVVHTIPRRYAALGLIVIAVILLGALVVVRHHENQTDGTSDVETITPAPSSMITSVGHVPASVASAVGVTSPTTPTTPPTATGNASLWQSSTTGAGPRPVVFFYGAEFAPYAAAERWPVVVALSRFGTFSALGLMQSSSSVAFSDTPTFTFWQVHYTQRLGGPADRRALQLAHAQPGSPSCRCRRRRPARRPRWRSTTPRP